MPGRQRIKIRASASSQADALALRQRIAAAVAAGLVHTEDRSPAIEQDEETGDIVVVSDVRFSRAQERGAVRGALAQLLLSLPRAEMTEHECFHGLEDDEDYLPCEATLTYRRFVGGGEVSRGVRNG